MNLKNVVKIAITSIMLVLVTGCAYLSPDGIPMQGGVIEGRVGDVGASAAIGVRDYEDRGGYGREGYSPEDAEGNGPRRPPQPCERTLAVMESAAGLSDWATSGGQGVETRRAQANAREGAGGRGGYNCNASVNAASQTVNGETTPPGMRRVMRSPEGYGNPGAGGYQQQGGYSEQGGYQQQSQPIWGQPGYAGSERRPYYGR